jgi:UDP-2,3-diacylglucosamine pyrophosphatase LpxH
MGMLLNLDLPPSASMSPPPIAKVVYPPALFHHLPVGLAIDGSESHDDDEDHHSDHGKKRFRSVFISDLHLGTAGCQAKALLAFLKAHPSDRLYLVGDIIDGWQLRRRWHWPQSHNDVVQKILRRARKGCKVVFVPGNHDEFARHFVGHSFGGVEVVREAIHTTANGKRLWVVHGDLFDGVIQYAKWIAYLGDNLYEMTLRLNRHLNSVRARMGLPYWSLSQYLKHRVKSALNYVLKFEAAVADEARKRGLDGVVCGHIHRAEMRDIDGVLYCNDGDWVESLTAIVESHDGNLSVVDWSSLVTEQHLTKKAATMA